MSIAIDSLSIKVGETIVCNNLSARFKRGECWAILGTNGTGKTTLLHHLIDVDSPYTDSITIENSPLTSFRHQRKQLAQKAGILLQDYEYNFPCSVLDAVLIGRHPFISGWQGESELDLAIAKDAIRRMELEDFINRDIDKLSGGEKRRVNIATLLCQNPDYLLLDEPTNHLDVKNQIKVLSFISQSTRSDNHCAIMVLHDANLARRYCDKVLMLFGDGQWIAGDSHELINVENLEKLYGCRIRTYNNENDIVFVAQ